ncbi:MAG: hypothetical protein OXI53_09950 [Nitrospira sp.]|nr:hypothetical protein [Nitrospira sp.]
MAKVSLWLHSFTVGAPLSFLDHHLRCGDSLIGLRVSEATEDLRKWASLFLSSAIAGAEAATEGMQSIEEMSDADVAEVRESAALFHGVEETTAELRGILNSLCGLRWFTAGMKQKKRAEFERPLVRMLALEPEDAYKRLARGPEHEDDVPPDCLVGVCRIVAENHIHRRQGRFPSLGSGLSGDMARLAKHQPARRF